MSYHYSRNPDAFPLLGSISSGTLRPEDLIPVFCDLLSDVIEWSTFQPGADAPENVARIATLQTELGEIEHRSELPAYYEREDLGASGWNEDLEWLFDTLSEFAPPLTYFGSNEGDGADFGYWVSSDAIEDAKRYPDEIASGDEFPESASEGTEFLQINERGNCELYRFRSGEWRSVWSCV